MEYNFEGNDFDKLFSRATAIYFYRTLTGNLACSIADVIDRYFVMILEAIVRLNVQPRVAERVINSECSNPRIPRTQFTPSKGDQEGIPHRTHGHILIKCTVNFTPGHSSMAGNPL